MRPYPVFFSDTYTLPLPPEHRFPMQKYEMLRSLLVDEGVVSALQLQASPLATRDEILLAHSPEYHDQIQTGAVPVEIIKRIGFPWSPQLYRRSCATVGGALSAALAALDFGVAGNLAGGTHHAHFDRGEGYCVFNDLAVAARHLLQSGRRKRVAILDFDVHQGNGNSSILRNDDGLFIVSVHGEKNYPFKKIPSHLDIGLPDRAGDEEFLEAIETALAATASFDPDFVFYQMGVDPLVYDVLGKLDVSFEGLIERDRRVFQFAKRRGLPISLALGGGYSRPIEMSVRAYSNTYRTLNSAYGFDTSHGLKGLKDSASPTMGLGPGVKFEG